MKGLLDESVPRKLVSDLQAFDCRIDPFPNDWKGIKNGELLDRMQKAGFQCLLTCDKNMQWQQSLRDRDVAVLVLPSQNLQLLRSIADDIAKAMNKIEIGQISHVILNRNRREN